MPNPVVHWEISCKDYPKAKAFYSKLFDWKIDDNNPMNYGAVETSGEGGINGGLMASSDKIPPYVTFYVQVDDLQACLDKAVSLGGQAVVPPTPIPNVGSFAMFTDPNDNCIGLFKPQ